MSETSKSPEREALEAYIGDKSLLARPPVLLRGDWDKAVQADAIESRVRTALNVAANVSPDGESSGPVGLSLDGSVLFGNEKNPRELMQALNLGLASVAKQAGLESGDAKLMEDRTPRLLDGVCRTLARIGFTEAAHPRLVVRLSDAVAAERLFNHARPPKLECAIA